MRASSPDRRAGCLLATLALVLLGGCTRVSMSSWEPADHPPPLRTPWPVQVVHAGGGDPVRDGDAVLLEWVPDDPGHARPEPRWVWTGHVEGSYPIGALGLRRAWRGLSEGSVVRLTMRPEGSPVHVWPELEAVPSKAVWATGEVTVRVRRRCPARFSVSTGRAFEIRPQFTGEYLDLRLSLWRGQPLAAGWLRVDCPDQRINQIQWAGVRHGPSADATRKMVDWRNDACSAAGGCR